MKDEVFNNTSRRVVRVFLGIAGGLTLIGAVPLILLWVLNIRGGASPDARQACQLAVCIISPLMLAMLFSGLLTIPTARQAEREFDRFRGGDLLARWEYPADFWLPYVEAETHRLRSVAKVAFWLVFGPVGVLAIYNGYFVARTAEHKIEVWAIFAAVVMVMIAVYILAARAVIRFRRKALLNCPRAYIGRTAVYCGGIFNFWGSQLRALDSVRQLPGHTAEHPGLLEFVIGMSTGARRATMAVDALTMLAMRPAYASSQSARQVIPIPPGEEARAAEIVGLFRKTMESGPPAKVSSHIPSPPHVAEPVHVAEPMVAAKPVIAAKPVVAAIKKAPALLGIHHDPVLLRKSARRCFVATVILLIGGLGMFLLAMPIDSGRPAGSEPSSLATFVEVIGLFAWVISPATLVMSIVQWFRSRR